jgi:hypothetical protein
MTGPRRLAFSKHERRRIRKGKDQSVNEAIDQIEEDEISDEALEATGARTEIAGAWTFVCTGIQCGHVFQ